MSVRDDVAASTIDIATDVKAVIHVAAVTPIESHGFGHGFGFAERLRVIEGVLARGQTSMFTGRAIFPQHLFPNRDLI